MTILRMLSKLDNEMNLEQSIENIVKYKYKMIDKKSSQARVK